MKATVRKGLMTLAINEANDCLAQLLAALQKRRCALDARGDLEKLGREATRKGNDLQREMGEPLDFAEWTGRCNLLPEEQQIVRIHADDRNTRANLLESRKRLQAVLDPFRAKPQTRDLFVALDSVPLDDRQEFTDRFIRLAESILLLIGQNRPKQVGRRNEQLASLKWQIHHLWSELEKPSYKDFCERLDATKIPLPDSVAWRKHRNWVQAFKQDQRAVSRWFSGAKLE
jgi:hypothetical protein